MKKVFTMIVMAVMLSVFSTAQAQLLTSDFETWSGSHHPAGWVGTKTSIDTTTGILMYTAAPHGGTKAVKLVNATTSHKRFTTTGLPIESGVSYEISYYAKGSGQLRCGITNLTTFTYKPYHTLSDTTNWVLYKDTVIGNGDTLTGEFIFSVLSTVAPAHIMIDDVTITELSVTIPQYTIYEIQYTTDASGNSPHMNEVVKTGGIVTAVGNGGYFLQSHVGPWNGVKVYDGNHTPALGDSVMVTGTVQEYFNLTEMGSIVTYEVVNTGNTIPGPEIVQNVLVNNESYEGVLVKIVNVACTDTTAGNGMFRVWDGNDTVYVDDLIYHYAAIPGTHYDITGVVTYDWSRFKLIPRDINDVVVNTSSVNENDLMEMAIYPNPVTNQLNLSMNGQADMIRVTDMLGNQVMIRNTNGLSNLTLDLGNLHAGNYVVSLMKDGAVVAHQIVVKQ